FSRLAHPEYASVLSSTPTTHNPTHSLHDALPIYRPRRITPTAASAPITAFSHGGIPVSTPSSSYTQLLTTVYITFLQACLMYFTEEAASGSCTMLGPPA